MKIFDQGNKSHLYSGSHSLYSVVWLIWEANNWSHKWCTLWRIQTVQNESVSVWQGRGGDKSGMMLPLSAHLCVTLPSFLKVALFKNKFCGFCLLAFDWKLLGKDSMFVSLRLCLCDCFSVSVNVCLLIQAGLVIGSSVWSGFLGPPLNQESEYCSFIHFIPHTWKWKPGTQITCKSVTFWHF